MEEIRITKYGKGMSLENPKRRNLYIEIQPDVQLNDIRKVIETLQDIKTSWEFEPSNIDGWYRYLPCKYCVSRVEYEHKKFIKGEKFWNRRYCLRHYFVEHFIEINHYHDMIISNRYLDLTMNRSRILLNTKTTNYNYNIEVTRQYAIVNVNYKGTNYKFKYNNHLNSLPYSSTYAIIVWDITRTAEFIAQLLDDIIRLTEKNKCTNYNVFINNKLVVSACT